MGNLGPHSTSQCGLEAAHGLEDIDALESGRETLLPPMYNTCIIFHFLRIEIIDGDYQDHGEADDGEGHDGQDNARIRILKAMYVQTCNCASR